MPFFIDLQVRIYRRRDAAQCHIVIERYPLADHRGLADHHAHPMVDEEPAADHRRRMHLDAGQPTGELREEFAEQEPSPAPCSVRGPVNQARVKAGIEKNYLEPRADRRVALDNRVNVLGNGSEHGRDY